MPVAMASSWMTRMPGPREVERLPSTEMFPVRVYPGALHDSKPDHFISVSMDKNSTSDEVVRLVTEQLGLAPAADYELAETFCSGGQLCKERRMEGSECPVKIQTLWPKLSAYIAKRHRTEYCFFLCKKEPDRRTGEWMEYAEPNPADTFLTTFLQQNLKRKEYSDLCNLPNLNEATLLDNLRRRFNAGNIYTYVGSILISVNPFKFYPIYNPKYVKMYQNRRLGDLPPHIFAIADAAYHTMLREKGNQCIVISGESGSGKTESTNLLLHHLSALSQKGCYGSGIEQTILGAGPVLEAFGNAKTVHNHNSSRFGKFIQVNYKENGMIHGAVVEKYLLEKSRIVSQSKNERNYHVFYYLLAGANDTERERLDLQQAQHYHYLNQSECFTLASLEGEDVDEAYELTRLQQSMEMVGFSLETQRRIFSVLAAVLHLGNISYKKKTDHAHHEAVAVQNIEEVKTICGLLKLKETMMLEALTKRRTLAGGETVVMNYKMSDAVGTRDAMAKCLYGALFDWIVLQINHAILSKREYKEHQGNSIGVLDIFGFEDFDRNSFEQFCINYANEHLHYYFNQHIFKFEQEEYQREGIQWKNIEFLDNTGCLNLFSQRPTGLLCLLDEECNFPGATNETLLAKFHAKHSGAMHYEEPQMKESAFHIVHYAGRVKYLIKDFREKNSDLIRQDIVLLLKNSSLAFVRELVGYDPVAVLRWAILRAFFRAFFAFRSAGRQHQKDSTNTMTRMGSVKKLKAQWDRNRPVDGSGDGSEFKHLPLSRRVAVDSQTRLEMALKLRNGNTEKPRKKTSNSAPTSPVKTSPNLPDTHSKNILDDPPKRRISSVGYILDAEDDLSSSGNESVESHDQQSHDSHVISKMASGVMNNCAGTTDPEERRILRRASKVLMKNKSFRPKAKPTKFRDLKAMKTLAGRRTLGPRPSKGKNKPPSVSAQFNYSLQSLMETLSQANPFFIRCIKSNVEKAPCVFDEDIVLRQLTYTGMLATVRIRQSGYNYRLTLEEFLQQYKVLLPKGLVSSREDIHKFLLQFDEMEENFQIGKGKIFLRETDKLVLDEMLHCAIMQRITFIQRWLKSRLERRRFVKLRTAALIIQCCVRSFMAKRQLDLLRQIHATVMIQRMFRGFRQRKALREQQEAACTIQKHVRGLICRKKYDKISPRRLALPDVTESADGPDGAAISCLPDDDQAPPPLPSVPPPSPGDLTTIPEIHVQSRPRRRPEPLRAKGVSMVTDSEKARADLHDFHSSASDEGVLSKELSSEEFLSDRLEKGSNKGLESEGSGILDDSESEISVYDTDTGKSRTTSLTSPPSSVPPSPFVPDLPPAASTPGNARRERVPSEPFKDIIDFHSPTCLRRSMSHQTPDKPRAHSVAVGYGAAQQPGPKDLELRVGPVSKAVSEEFLTYETKSIRLDSSVSPFIRAPMAKPDHFSEFEDSMHQSPLLEKKQTSMSSLADGVSLSSQTSASAKSPFHEAKKKIKQLVTGGKKKKDDLYDSDDSQTEETSVADVPISVKPAKFKEPCDDAGTKPKHRRKNSKKKRASKEKGTKVAATTTVVTATSVSTWSVSSTSQWQYPADKVVNSAGELRQLENFVSQKLMKLMKGDKRETVFDHVFKRALLAFHNDLITQISVTQQEDSVRTYRDLMSNFEEILKRHAQTQGTDEEFPVTMGINAFRGFLDEFNKKKEHRELPEVKVKKDKRKKEKEKEHILEHNGHRYIQAQFSIHTYCESCMSHIWLLDKALVCQVCRYTVHKKCYSKSSDKCKWAHEDSSHCKRVFGVPLHVLLLPGEVVPAIIERLLSTIENTWLYTVGLYRKGGAAAKIREIMKEIDADPLGLDLSQYQVHVLTAAVKRFMLELPEPLLTFDLYDDLLIASEISDDRERVQGIYSVLDKLPTAHHDLLGRLVFHLAKVAQHEEFNKMSANGLAIIFSPSLMRTDRQLTAQESLNVVGKQTICLQTIIEEQMRKIKSTLADITTLNSAAHTAKSRLLQVRASIQAQDKRELLMDREFAMHEEEEEEQLLSEQIAFFEQRKETLTAQLPTLETQWSSSEEDLLSTEELDDAGLCDTTDPDFQEYAVSFDYPASPPKHLTHLNKRRAPLPRRQLSTPRKRVKPSSRAPEDSDEGDDEVPRRNALAAPQLETMGAEIIV